MKDMKPYSEKQKEAIKKLLKRSKPIIAGKPTTRTENSPKG